MQNTYRLPSYTNCEIAEAVERSFIQITIMYLFSQQATVLMKPLK